MKRTSQSIVDECIRRRTIQNESINKIAKAIGIAKSTVFGILKPYPLSTERITAGRTLGAKLAGAAHRQRSEYRKLAESPFFEIMNKRALTTDQRGSVSEFAVVFRLLVWGFIPHVSLVPGRKSDITTAIPETGKILRIQVKTTTRGKHGAPTVGLTWKGNGKGRKLYSAKDVDIIAAYDARTDKCFVFTLPEIAEKKASITARPDAMERWDKLISFGV